MKVCLINTADSGGGAPVACRRLLHALDSNIEANMLVQSKKTNNPAILSVTNNRFDKFTAELNFLSERLPFIAFYEKDKSVRFAFSTANIGTNISNHISIEQADILHLHWINRGFLSIKNLKQLFQLQKPIVWTLHDMWTFTGGCHYAGTCNYYLQECGNCKFLRAPSENDLSKKGWLKKKDLYTQNKKIVFVACSKWIAQLASKSSLLKGARIEAIPNPIDTTLYKPLDKITIRKKWGIDLDTKIILFGAANINDSRKGISYLIDAIKLLKQNNPQNLKIEIILFGKNTSLDPQQLPFPAKSLSTITSEQELIEVYNLADVFVLPSLEDNLPNMVMEALSCGIPVVGFNQGGTPEMIDHQQNGYVAKYQSVEDLQAGISWVLNNNIINLKNNARQKVLDNYSEAIVAQQYQQLYESLKID
jgi:glycosyltransferase involved in cell wall biosynthesis